MKVKGIRLQWRIFISMFVVAMVILLILWGCQVLFIGSFYQHAKTVELKAATNEVIANLESDQSEAIFDRIIRQGDINIRIKNMSDFENDVYTGGDSLISATHDIGDFEILRLYELAIENGGEISQYYTYDKNNQMFLSFPPERENRVPKPQNDADTVVDGKREIGVQFFKGRPGMFFRNDRYVDDFLYAKVVKMSDGNEIMVISDVQVTPLDSTVTILKTQLSFTSFVALIFTLVLSYFISKSISKPIEKLNRSALKLAQGDFKTKFSGNGYREIEQLSDTLNYTAGELGKAEQFRNELLANVSHDLRTPLTMIGGYAEVMRDIPGENTPENVQVIIDETHRLTDFVNDMLDLSKLKSGIEEIKKEPVNITKLLESISERYLNLTKNDGYVVEMQADKDIRVMCDEAKITQAFYNLMDNAVNHTGEDKKVVIRQIENTRKVRIEISDTGEGIPAEQLPYIWDRYYRVDANHKRSLVGSGGIGLSIVKYVFELHNLKYGVESNDRIGTTFWVEFDRIK